MNYLAVLASGGGTNLQALLDACSSGELPDTRVSVVVANHRDAYALERARRAGVPTIYHPLLPYRKAGVDRKQYDADLARMLLSYPVDLVVMAGWMHIFSLAFLRCFSGRLLNIHPALPGAFPGTHSIERAYDAFQAGEITETGVMVHRVPDEEVDVGPVVVQEVVPILPGETLQALETRIHVAEHQLYVRAIAQELGLNR